MAAKKLFNNRYILKGEIGQGGMGTVYRAYDRLFGETVALKRVSLPTGNLIDSSKLYAVVEKELRLLLANEFQTLATLHHPNIIRVLDYGFNLQNEPYFTMEYLKDTKTILHAASDLDLNEAIDLLQQLLQGLAYLHRRDILHRDLKPQNVLVTSGVLQLLDFGLSASEGDRYSSGGSMAYVAPESWHQEPVHRGSDLYAVGVMAYEIFAGHHPFAPMDHAMLDRILEASPDLKKLEVNDDLQFVIGKLLEKNPEDRFENAESALAALSEAIGKPVPLETQAIRESYLQASAFVGRESEIKLLREGVEALKKGEGSSWLIGGESGVGKSRLLKEVETEAVVDGIQVFLGQAAAERNVPHQIWQDPLRRLILHTDLSELEVGVLAELVPEIGRLLDRPVPQIPKFEGIEGRNRLFNVISELFSRQKTPTLLILEDLHWIKDSPELLRLVNALTSKQPLMVVGSYRSDENVELPDHLDEMRAISLPRLSPSEIKELSARVLGRVGQRDDLLHYLQRESEGNTYFLVEIVRALAEEAGNLKEIGEMALPEHLLPKGIRTIVDQRLSRIPSTSQQLLFGAAALGRRLNLNFLNHFAAQLNFKDELSVWLGMCANAAFVEYIDGQWRFTHDKLREGLLSKHNAEDYALLHQNAALAVESAFPEDDRQAAALTYLWGQAGAREKERKYAKKAGEISAVKFELEAAISFLSRTLDLTPENAYQDRFDLLFAREDVFNQRGERELQAADLEILENIADRIGTPLNIATVAVCKSRYFEQTSDYPSAIEFAQKAVSLFAPLLETSIEDEAQRMMMERRMAQARLAWGGGLATQGNYDQAKPHYEAALAWLRPLGKTPQLAQALRQSGILAWRLAKFSEADEKFREALHIAEEIDDLQQQGANWNNLGIVARDRGEYDLAMRYYGQSLEIYRKLGNRYAESINLQNLGFVSYDLGQYEQSVVHLMGALPLKIETSDKYGELLVRRVLSHVSRALEAYEESTKHMAQALRLQEEIGHQSLSNELLIEKGFLLIAQKRYDEAGEIFERSIEYLPAGENHLLSINLPAGRAAVAASKGDFLGALTHIERILSFLETKPSLEGQNYPFIAFPIIVKILREINDFRAEPTLEFAYQTLMAHAQKISDQDLRNSFLHNVPEHREILQYYAEGENEGVAS